MEHSACRVSLQPACRVLTTVFITLIASSLLAVVLDGAMIRDLSRFESGEFLSASSNSALKIRAGIESFQGWLTRIGILTFLWWFYRAHKNLTDGGLDNLDYTPGWAVGGFFVPFLGFIRPFQVMREVWSGSTFLSRDVEAESWREIPNSKVVGWWWGSFLVMAFVSLTLARLAGTVRPITFSTFLLVSDAIHVTAAVAALLLVRRVTNLQEKALHYLPVIHIRTLASANLETTEGEVPKEVDV